MRTERDGAAAAASWDRDESGVKSPPIYTVRFLCDISLVCWQTADLHKSDLARRFRLKSCSVQM